MTRAAVYVPDGRPGPGRLSEVDLDVLGLGPAELVVPEVTVRDERGGELFDGAALVFDPAAGGGPLAGQGADRQARAFGVVNAAFHAQRALRYAADLLGHSLPRLLVRIGMHNEPRRWGGGHYRLPDPADDEPVRVHPDGEVHLGGGAAFVRYRGGRYFHAPAHNAAIVYHEAGHHLARHTADFRLNRLRPPDNQISGKTGIDEGTADVIAAAMLARPDVYAWHRAHIPESDQRRRKLDRRWTMAVFRGGRDHDQHADGTVWASACWSARERVVAAGWPPTRFDAMLLRGLEQFDRDNRPGALSGNGTAERARADALRPRRHFSRLLAAMITADSQLAPLVLAAMAEHGIRTGASNAELREAAREQEAT
jgi:hypothetical protein